jgi:hypothetical protein
MEDLTPRQMRLGTTVRGAIITGLLVCYGVLVDEPGASLIAGLLVAAGLQILVLILRRVIPPEALPQVMYLFELLVDAATVLLFALGVFGGIVRAGLGA